MLTAIRQWVVKKMMKSQTGVVQTLPKKELIELNTQITAERMMRNGINPEDMKTVGQVENVINQMDTPKVNVNPGITGIKKADVMDMEGNKIDTSKGIMGGKELPGETNIFSNQYLNDLDKKIIDSDAFGYTQKEWNNLSSSSKEKFRRQFDSNYEDAMENTEMAPIKTIESDAAIKARLDANNKKGIASMKKKLEDPEEKAEGGRIGLMAGSIPKISAVISALLKNKKKVQQAVDDIFPTGDYKYDADMAADALVENNPKVFNNLLREDLPDEVSSEIYGAVLRPITNKMAIQMQLKRASRPEKTLASINEGKGINMSDPEIADEFGRFMKETDPKGYKELEQKVELSNFKTKDRKGNADGGRIGLKAGMSKRGFLKLMGSVGAGIGAAKSGIFSGFGKGAGKTVAKEVAQQTTSGMPPPYFFKLAEKIKTMGTDVTSTSERTITKSLKSKNGKSEYILEEDMATGDTLIKKVNKEGDDMITDVEIMELRKGEDVVTKDGKAIKTQDQYEEVTETNSRINKDNYNASSYEDGMAEESLKDIIEEASEQAPSIKYASGGLAYMLGE